MSKYDKYQNMFKYAGKIAFDYYRKKRDLFKQIPMDGNDVKQEVYIAVMKAIDVYEKRYESEKKVYLTKYIKTVTYNIVRNLLRDNAKKSFFAVESEERNLRKILDSPNSTKKMKREAKKKLKKLYEEKEGKTILNKKDIAIELQNDNYLDEILSNDVQTLLKKFTKDEREYKIIYGRIVENCTVRELSERLNISKMRVSQIYKVIIDRMKHDSDRI